MRILITNDDGIQSPSLRQLAQTLSAIAEVIVVAPLREQSGVGHAFSFFAPIRFGKEASYGCEAYWLEGTPSDCTKFAICEILKDRLPDVVISGPNTGENAGVAAVYSGTVAGAREAALWNIPAIALSQQAPKPVVLDMCIQWMSKIIKEGAWQQISLGTYWSVNFPDVPLEFYKGVQVCTMSTIMFVDEYIAQTNPRGQIDYWITGFKDRPSFPEGSDDWWLAQGYATLTPLTVDQTALSEVQRLLNLKSLPGVETR